MDISQMISTLNHHPKTSRLYRNGSIWTAHTGGEITVAGDSAETLLTALEVLTGNESLYMRAVTLSGEWCAIITGPPTHVSVTTDRAVNSTIIGTTIHNLEPNQGVQGVFNTPIHFGKK